VIFWRPLTVLQEFDAMTAPSSIDSEDGRGLTGRV
jgi:hypothetical protein